MSDAGSLWRDAWETLHQFADVPFPKWIKVRQRLPLPKVDSIDDALRRELAKDGIRNRIAPGMRVAVAVGSRGVANISALVSGVVRALKEWGAEPFIVPAMGSHGAATADGQAEYLAGLGVSERTTGAPVRATMDVVELGETSEGIKVHVDRYAADADAIVPVCRVKPHTSFRGPVESGALKMLAVGLGKQKGAESLHSFGFPGFSQRIVEAARVVCSRRSVPFAVCVVENARDETALVEAVPGEALLDREPELLKEAWRLTGRILVDELDVLVVGEIGKNISGVGMDPNITGRFSTQGMSGGCRVNKLVALSISEMSHGNALGMGLADIVTARLVDAVDFRASYVNCITSTIFTSVKVPLCARTDRDAVGVALRTCNRHPTESARLAYIHNTLELDEIYVSESVWREHEGAGLFERLDDLEPIPFDAEGRLLISPNAR